MNRLKFKLGSYNESIFSWLFASFAFCLPFNNFFLTAIIILISFCWIFQFDVSLLINELKEHIVPGFIILLFLLHVIGYFYSDNSAYAIKDIEQKIPFLVFPIIMFSLHRRIVINHHLIFRAFIGGNILASIICLWRAFGAYNITHDLHAFFYTGFSGIMHPSYFALFITTAIIFLLSDEELSGGKWLWLKGVIFIFFLSIITLLSSKAGVISLAVALLSMIYIHRKRSLKYRVLLFLSAVILVIVNFYALPDQLNRMKVMEHTLQSSQVKSDESESTGQRIYLWKAGLAVARENIWIGTGTGDVKDELAKEYLERDMKVASEKRFNAHSQFIQTFAALGLPGFICLSLIFGLIIAAGYYNKHPLVILIAVIFVFNISIESMLETQGGIMYFSFFFPLLLQQLISTHHIENA